MKRQIVEVAILVAALVAAESFDWHGAIIALRQLSDLGGRNSLAALHNNMGVVAGNFSNAAYGAS